MVSLTKLYDEGGRPAVQEYLRQLEQHDTTEEIADRAGFIRGWCAARDAYDPTY